jgi:hypothetical protein
MPTYVDIHDLPGVKAADVVGAHDADVAFQGEFGVNYRHYWVDESDGKVFCLVDAPDQGDGRPRPPPGSRSRSTHAVRGGAGRVVPSRISLRVTGGELWPYSSRGCARSLVISLCPARSRAR